MDYPISLFIDTNYFIRNKFDFSKGELKSLVEHCQGDRIKLYTSDIVINEVEKHIKEDTAKALSNIRNEIKKENRLLALRNKKKYEFLFQDIRDIGIIDEMISDYKKFRDDSKSILLDYSGVNPKLVFDKYFAKEAPFGKGDKKAEFPDAFMIEAIKALDFDNKFKIISQDNDWKKSFEGSEIEVVDGISQLITTINEEVYADKYKATINYISTPEFKQSFEAELPDEIYNLDVELDADEIIDTIEIIGVNLIEYKFDSIDYIDTEAIEMTFLVNADITVAYTYFDEENSVYDTIDHEYVYQHIAEIEEVHKVGLEIVVTLDTNDDLEKLVIGYYSTSLNETKLILDDDSLKERTRNDEDEPFGGYYEFEPELVGDSSTKNDLMDCPDCGKKYDYMNDGGNGFCSACGPNH